MDRSEIAFVRTVVIVDGENVCELALVKAHKEMRVDAFTNLLVDRHLVGPGASASMVFIVEVTSVCSFLAIEEETKIPRCPTFSCTM